MTGEYEEIILADAEDDYLSLVDFYVIFARENGQGDVAARRAGELAAEMIRAGTIAPGFLGDGFQPWRTTPAEGARRIVEYVRQLPRDGVEIVFGVPCWFDLTAASGKWGEPCSPDEVPSWE